MPNTPPNRRGIATLEFAISLPVLLTLMVGMTWLGFSVISQTEVNIEARQKAWKRRFEDAAKKPLVFTATPLYDKNADYIIERAEKKVAVSPMFDTLPGANGAHTILAGSWDHRAMPMNEPPNMKLHMVAVANAKTAGFQTTLGNLDNLVDQFQNSAGDVLAEQLGLGNQLDGLADGANSGSEAAQDQSERDRQARKQELQQQKQQLNTELQATDKQINDLRAEYVKKLADEEKEPDPEKKKLIAKKRDRISQNIDLQKGKRTRLENELRDVNTELDGLED